MLGGLQFGGIGGQINQLDTVGSGQSGFGMPSRAIEHENDDALFSRADGLSEIGKQEFVEFLADAVGQIPDRLASCRQDEGCDVKPFKAMMAQGERPFADGSPDPSAYRLQAQPVLIRRPDLNRQAGVPAGLFSEDIAQLFLKA